MNALRDRLVPKLLVPELRLGTDWYPEGVEPSKPRVGRREPGYPGLQKKCDPTLKGLYSRTTSGTLTGFARRVGTVPSVPGSAVNPGLWRLNAFRVENGHGLLRKLGAGGAT